MKELTAELEQIFGVAPDRETGLVIDTFDGAGFDGDARRCFTRAAACGGTRVSVQA